MRIQEIQKQIVLVQSFSTYIKSKWGFLGHLVYVGPAHEKSRKFQSSLGVETRSLSSSTAEDCQ